METKEQYKERVAHLESDLHNLEGYMEEFTSFLPLPVCIVNADEVIVDNNEAFADFLEYSKNDEGAGTLLANIFVEDKALEELLTAARQSPDSALERDLTLVTTSGEEKSVTVTVSARHDIHDEYTGYFLGVTPIPEPAESQQAPPPSPEEEPKAEQELQKSKSKLAHEKEKSQAVIDSMRDGVLVIDNEGRVDSINAKAAETLSLDQADIHGEKIADLDYHKRLVPLIEKIADKSSEEEELKLGDQTFEVTIRSTTTENGQTYRLVILHDVSEDEFVEDMKLTFVSVAAHQIRTPLSAIRWSLEILVNQLKDPEQKKVAQRGYRSTKNMLEIVNELLNLDRLQSGKDGYSFEPVNTTELIQQYVDEVKSNDELIDQPTVVFEKPIDRLPKVRADREKLRVVFRNLIDNALKYTDSDGSVEIESSVHVTNDYGNDMIQISVSDTGIGIPPEAQDKIFSKFYRADNATAEQTDGTGVGLYITKQIVEAHDGTIWFESEPDEGTTFFVQLPIAQTQD